MKRIITSIWDYFKEMNSEKGGGVSIKRNITWGIATLLVFVQVFSLMALYRLILAHTGQVRLVDVFQYLCTTYILVDAVMILLALRITSIEKITTLAGTLKGDKPKEAAETKEGE